MKILVPVKRVIDYNVKARPKDDGSDVDLSMVKMGLNPFCEIAIEAALRIKDENDQCEVIAVSVGEKQAQEQIRTALAMGADRGILVEAGGPLEPLAVAKCLKLIADRECPDLLIFGKQGIDSDNNQTGQMVAGLCGYPQGTFCSAIDIIGDVVAITREIDGGSEVWELPLPAVLTADLRLNEPRYASLPNIMKAKKKPLEVMALSGLGVDARARQTLLGVSLPSERKPGIKVDSVTALIEKLKNEAKVIL